MLRHFLFLEDIAYPCGDEPAIAHEKLDRTRKFQIYIVERRNGELIYQKPCLTWPSEAT